MCLIDKHAAHERILYEDLMAGFGVRSSQMLLCPVTVQVSAQEKHTLLDAQELLQEKRPRGRGLWNRRGRCACGTR